MPGVGDRFLDVDGGNARKRTAPYLIRVADGGFGVIAIENKLAGGARFVRFDGKPVHRWRVEQYLSCENQFAVAQKPLAGAADLWELELRAKDALGDRRQGLFIDNRSACRARRFERMADGVAIRFDGVRLPDGEADVVACVRLTEWGHLNSVKMIFDTDMYTDFDDAGALACLNALADAGECEILATIANTRESKSVAMCEIINAYYGRPDIPVGCVKGIGMGNDRRGEHERRYGATVKKYAKWVKHPNSDDAPDAAEVYRQVLSAQPDKSVVICSVGFLSNMCKLMETDRDLVAQKVKLWVAMACFYPKGKEYNLMNRMGTRPPLRAG